MGKTRPPYAKEFRAEAVRLVRESGKALAQIAQDLGLSEPSLRPWRKQTELDNGKRSDGLTTEEHAEVRRLRRENRILREEREILRKVVHAALRGTSERMKVFVGEAVELSVPVA